MEHEDAVYPNQRCNAVPDAVAFYGLQRLFCHHARTNGVVSLQ